MHRTRTTTFSAALFVLAAVSGCGGSSTFANKPRPPIPVNLTVYVNNVRVSVSPASVGAGEVVFIVTNGSNRAQSLSISPAGQSSQSLARTAPINPQGTGQVAVDITHPGDYSVTTSSAGGGTDAALATQAPIRPASIHIGPPRANSSNQLLQP